LNDGIELRVISIEDERDHYGNKLYKIITLKSWRWVGFWRYRHKILDWTKL